MGPSTLAMEIRHVTDTASIVDITGEITSASEGPLMEAYERAAAEKTRVVILNCTALEYMNSGGIGLLVTLLVRANRLKKQLFSLGLSDHYREIFELTRLDEAITIYDDEASAIAAAAA